MHHHHCDDQSNQPGQDEGENLYKRDEHSTANVGEEEGEDVPSQPPAEHRHAAVHIYRSLGMEVLKIRII